MGGPEGGGWCERLRREWMRLPNTPVVYPLGVRGDGLEKVAHRWQQEWRCRGELRRKTPDAILLSVGINDLPALAGRMGAHSSVRTPSASECVSCWLKCNVALPCLRYWANARGRCRDALRRLPLVQQRHDSEL